MASKVRNDSPAKVARREAHIAVAGPSPKKAHLAAKAEGDSFKKGQLTALAPLRPPATAVMLVNAFEKGLKLSPENAALRRQNMQSSPIAFFRSNPALFFSDQRGAYDAKLLGRPAPKVTIGGDTHLANFGVIRGPGPDHEPVWAINDFDQAGTGSPEADLERLAVSAVLVARAHGESPGEQRHLVEKLVEAYVGGVEQGGGGYVDAHDASGYVHDVIDTAKGQTREAALDQLTKGEKKFRFGPELVELDAAKAAAVTSAVEDYASRLPEDAPVARPIKVLDVARRLNSGGSTLGLDRFYALAEGPAGGHPRVLELKQVPPPAVEGSSPDVSKANPARIVECAEQLSGFKSPFLGSTVLDGVPMLVRELEPEKVRVDPANLKQDELKDLVEQGGKMLAGSHGHQAELKRWLGSDTQMLKDNLADFAVRYANQTEQDWRAFGGH